MQVDNIAIHYYSNIECIAKCAVNLKRGKKIVFRLALKDPAARNNGFSFTIKGGIKCGINRYAFLVLVGL